MWISQCLWNVRGFGKQRVHLRKGRQVNQSIQVWIKSPRDQNKAIFMTQTFNLILLIFSIIDIGWGVNHFVVVLILVLLVPALQNRTSSQLFWTSTIKTSGSTPHNIVCWTLLKITFSLVQLKFSIACVSRVKFHQALLFWPQTWELYSFYPAKIMLVQALQNRANISW